MTRRLVFALFALPTLAWATVQVPDKLIFEGKSHELYAVPLESYFSGRRPRPKWLKETNTACWRGYVATWEVVDDMLYLKRVDLGNFEKPKNLTPRLFPGKKPPIPADWFSGTVRVPMGKVLPNAPVVFGPVREEDLFLTFENGRLVKRHRVDNRGKSGSSPPRTVP
jgi:hypothetical protein